jgi:subtilisin family serine protease
MREIARRLVRRSGPIIVIGLASLIFAATPAFARQARLSRALQEQLADPSVTSVNVILQGPQAEIDRIASSYGVRVVKRMDMGAVIAGSAAQVRAVAGDRNVGSLTGDDVVVSTMAISAESTGSSLLWKGVDGSNFGGLVGSGIGVAVIDSGIGLHADVDRRVRLRVDFVNDQLGTPDPYGHGTHVASLIAGSGAGSRDQNGADYIGMAPGAELVSLRVLDKDGYGLVSDVVLALEWAIKNKDRYRLRVVNLSLGLATKESYRTAPMALAVERAVSEGLIVVASAGNYGKLDDGTPIVGVIVSPGHTPGALTVGALNTRGTVERSDDAVATYSSRGPVGDPDAESTWELKPDLVAPGNAIIGAAVADSYLWNRLSDRQVIGASGGTYLTMSGASMSTAVVSGAVAQLLQAAPALTPGQVKFVLQFTAQYLEGFGLIEQGAGSLNVPLAVALASVGDLTESPSSVHRRRDGGRRRARVSRFKGLRFKWRLGLGQQQGVDRRPQREREWGCVGR